MLGSLSLLSQKCPCIRFILLSKNVGFRKMIQANNETPKLTFGGRLCHHSHGRFPVFVFVFWIETLIVVCTGIRTELTCQCLCSRP